MANTANITAVITAQDKASGVIKGFGDNVNSQVTKIGVGMAAVGAGFTLLTKNSIDYTKELVTNTKMLQRETGATAKEASGLLYVTNRLGMSAEETSRSFGIFSKTIKQSTEASQQDIIKQADLQAKIKDTGLEHDVLKNKIDGARIKIAQITEEIRKNGDKSGELTVKLKSLQLTTTGYENDLSNLTIETSKYKRELEGTASPLQKLHINTKNADGSTKSFNQILLETADRFKAMPAGAEKTALALELFGRSGKDMIKVLNLGSQGIQDLEKNAEKLGLTLDQKNIGQVSRFIQSQKNLKDTTNALRIQIGLLTAPILTNFTQKITEVANKIIQTDGPFRGLLAHVIAFGGPLAGAGGAMIAFGANLAQVLANVRGLGVGLAGLATFMTGPLGVVLAGVGVLAGVLASQFFNQTTKTNELRVATDSLKTSEDNLKNTKLALQGANLAVEQAQRAYNDAVKQFGPDSLEARQALYNLQVAKDQVKDASKRAEQAERDLGKAQQEVAKQKEIIKHLQEVQANLQGVGRDAFNAGEQIKRIDGSKVTVKTSKNAAGVQTVDFVSTFGRRAQGGPIKPGVPYLVGERGPELVIPSQSGTVIPNDRVTPSTDRGTVNINISAGAFMGSDVEARKFAQLILTHLKDSASLRNMSVGQMIGY